jgi:hypothetical protein
VSGSVDVDEQVILQPLDGGLKLTDNFHGCAIVMHLHCEGDVSQASESIVYLLLASEVSVQVPKIVVGVLSWGSHIMHHFGMYLPTIDGFSSAHGAEDFWIVSESHSYILGLDPTPHLMYDEGCEVGPPVQDEAQL